MSIWMGLTKNNGNKVIIKKEAIYSVEEIISVKREKVVQGCAVTLITPAGVIYGDPLMVKDDYASICNRM